MMKSPTVRLYLKEHLNWLKMSSNILIGDHIVNLYHTMIDIHFIDIKIKDED